MLPLPFVFVLCFGFGYAARESGCPRVCPPAPREPICASDGLIYPSQCDMKRKNCGKGLTTSDTCTAVSGSACGHRCDKEKDLVCGNDGHTYLNSCYLKVQNCRSGVNFSHFGPCNNISAHRENCPVDCNQAPNDGPVCGSDGNVYPNSCAMKKLTCGQGVVRTSKRNCQTTRHCRESCWRNAKPTCGSDGVIYPNSCRMKSKNCGKHVFEVPMAYCLSQERNSQGGEGAEECPTSCPTGGDSKDFICGSDGMIYGSECEVNLLNCGSHSKKKVVQVDFEKCRNKYNKCSKIKCEGGSDEPVCGSDGRTYESACTLSIATCLKGVQLAHLGVCSELTSRTDCPTHCPTELSPVCGSDGNVYRNECELKNATCGQHVVPVSPSNCPTTANCGVDCSTEPVNYVCGSDNKFYRSACDMKKDNCGKHVYEVPLKTCLNLFKFTSACARICPVFYEPICASNNKTYSNSCFLQLENCKTGKSLSVVHHGKCGSPKEPVHNYLF